MIDLNDKERELLIGLLRERGESSYETAIGNWGTPWNETHRKELYAESKFAYALAEKLTTYTNG